jgi:hypothetical protein
VKYTVVWQESAEERLADIWLASEDRAAISVAARDIDRFLRNQPKSAGESRPAEKRMLLVAPLGVIFRVYEQDRIVLVASVWRFRQHS